MRKLVFAILFLIFLVTFSLLNSIITVIPANAYSGIILSAWAPTPPTIDGTLNANTEWVMADKEPFIIAGSHSGTLYVMNDATNLYLAVKIADDDFGTNGTTQDVVAFYFDNDHDGVGPEMGDDHLYIRSFGIGTYFFDQFFTSPFYNSDGSDGGTNDGVIAPSGDGSYNYFEISHSLNSSDDTHDFSLSPGDIVGFMMSYADNNTYVGSWPADANPFDNPTNWHEIKIASSIYQGDLMLSDNEVYTIEGRFDINGSIIVEENATLILRNALVNFTQVGHLQFGMTFRNPADGNPRLIVDNASLETNGYDLNVQFYANSTAEINELSTILPYVGILLYGEASVKISNSTCEYVGAQHSSVISALDSSFYQIAAWDNTNASVSNCTLNCIYAGGRTNFTLTNNCTIIDDVQINAYNLNYSINGLKPGFIKYWNFPLNCSATGIWVPNLTLENTNLGGWSFYSRGHSNATFTSSKLYVLWFQDFSQGQLHDTTLKYLNAYDDSEIYCFDSTGDIAYLYASSRIWAVNSTVNSSYTYGQSRVYVYWYLDVHVIDSIGQNVPSASVTATYPNATLAESKLTDASGWARLTLMEAMANVTGYYPIGTYTLEATYEAYSNTTTVDMIENQQIALTLEDFEVPEFPPQIVLPLLIIVTLLTVIISKRKLFHKAKTWR